MNPRPLGETTANRLAHLSRAADRIILARLGELQRRTADLDPGWSALGDAALVVATVAVSLLGLHDQHRLGPLSAAFGLGIAAPLLLRRRHPVGAFAVIALIAFLQWLFDVPQLADASVLFALYWVARDRPALSVLGAACTVEAGAIIAAVQWSPADSPKIWVGLTGLTVASAVLGITVRQRRTLLASLEERAARLELERDREGRLGAAAERARIAREMHDIVSHNLTVMIALADAATFAMEATPDQAASAVGRVATTGRQALGEMRRLLGLLRDEPAAQPLEPQPTLTRLDALLASVEAAGLPVSLTVHGDPHALEEGVQVTVYRVVQEALTNTLKHAVAPTGAAVHLTCRGADAVTLSVLDDGESVVAAASVAREGGGRGLLGMRERASAFGGTLTAGPGVDGGWRIQLRIGPGAADGPGAGDGETA